LILAPFAPHLSEEFWEKLWNGFSVFNQKVWPKYDEGCLVQDTVKMAVQFNGKVRWTIDISPSATQDNVMELIKINEKIAKYLEWNIVKIIYIPGKICNIVVK
jgi:leucyl-tRNA synthetase